MAAIIRNGPNATDASHGDHIVGKTVRELRTAFAEALNITTGSRAYVRHGGEAADPLPAADDYVMQENDVLDFAYSGGPKGPEGR